MAFNSSTLQYPREKLPQPAVSVLYTSPEVNFQYVRFFITRKDFESRLNILTFYFWKIQIFSTFVKNNIDVVIDKDFVYGDLKVFFHFLENVSLNKVPIDPKGMFKKVCFNFPFEFLIMFDLFREHAC